MQPWVKPILSNPPTVDAQALHNHVRYLSVDLYPRSFDMPEHLEAAADYIKKQWSAQGLEVIEQPVHVEGVTYKNLIVKLGPPADQTHPLIIIGAHYDSHGNAQAGAKFDKGYSPDTHTPGADDNASGVAGLIELAKLLKHNPPNQPVELVAYTLEEPPNYRTSNMGSVWHAQSIQQAATPVKLMISLEMIGYFNDAPHSQDYPFSALSHLYPDAGNFIGLVSRPSDWSQTRQLKAYMSGATDLPVHSINTTPRIQGIDFSDHRSYWALDYPAIMVTDTSFQRNHAYHEAGDTHDRLDYQRMAKVVQGVYSYVTANTH